MPTIELGCTYFPAKYDFDKDNENYRILKKLKEDKSILEQDIQIIGSMFNLHPKFSSLNDALIEAGYLLTENQREPQIEMLWKKGDSEATYLKKNFEKMWSMRETDTIKITYSRGNLEALFEDIESTDDNGDVTHGVYLKIKTGEDILVEHKKTDSRKRFYREWISTVESNLF